MYLCFWTRTKLENLGIYRNHRGHRAVHDRFLECFRSQFFIAQGCDNSDRCDDSDTCADIELNVPSHPPPVRRLRYVRSKSNHSRHGSTWCVGIATYDISTTTQPNTHRHTHAQAAEQRKRRKHNSPAFLDPGIDSPLSQTFSPTNFFCKPESFASLVVWLSVRF